MGMICYLLRFTAEQVDLFRASPQLTSDLVWVAVDDERSAQMAEIMKRWTADKRAQIEAQQQQDDPLWREQAAQIAASRVRLKPFGEIAPALSLEKSWHMLHYLFTGSIGPVGTPGDALLTGEEIGEDVAGYGAPRWQTPDETRAFGMFLKELDGAKLASRVNLKNMAAAGVYGMPRGLGSETEEPGLREEAAHFFTLLRDYVALASEKNDGFLTWIV